MKHEKRIERVEKDVAELKSKGENMQTLNEVYPNGIKVPEGYEMVGFRPLREGDTFLANVSGSEILTETWVAGTNPRAVIQKIPPPPPPTTIRVVRVLEYVGPEDWVNTTLSKSAVNHNGPVRPDGTPHWPGADRTIRQLSIFKEEVK